MIYRHGLRVSEACDLRWDDIDLTKRTILVRRLKGSADSSHTWNAMNWPASSCYGISKPSNTSSRPMSSSTSAASRSGAWALPG